MYATFGAARDYKGGKYGVGVLSKEKPISHRRVTLPCTSEERVLLIVEFKDYYFCSTHYSLLEEYRIIASNIICEEAAKLDKPMFVAGDFNALRDAEPMQILAQDFYVFEKMYDKLTFPADVPTKEIDFICMYKHHSVVPVVYNHVVVPAVVESDHRPIVADIELYKR
jgi:endonuclease/exonuclease/phosphatase family metal-dependent hydrolase